MNSSTCGVLSPTEFEALLTAWETANLPSQPLGPVDLCLPSTPVLSLEWADRRDREPSVILYGLSCRLALIVSNQGICDTLLEGFEVQIEVPHKPSLLIQPHADLALQCVLTWRDGIVPIALTLPRPNLPPGVYNAFLTLRVAPPASDATILPFCLVLEYRTAEELLVEPQRLSIPLDLLPSIIQGLPVDLPKITIWGSGSSPKPWSIELKTSVPWLSISPERFTLNPLAVQEITLYIQLHQYAPGMHGEIVITATGENQNVLTRMVKILL